MSEKLLMQKLGETIRTKREIVSEKLQIFHQLKLNIETAEEDAHFLTGK